MPANEPTRCLITGAAKRRGSLLSIDTLTDITPATSGPRSAASRRDSVAPMERPPVTTESHVSSKESKARSTSPYHCCHVVVFRSRQVVP